MNSKEILKKYGADITHSKQTAKLSLLLFDKLKEEFAVLKKYDNKRDLDLLYKGALLHDIGIKFEETYGLPHHKAGARYITDNPPDDIDEEDSGVLACLIRYHRKSLPDDNKYKPYKTLSQTNKAKVNYLGAIIRLADGLDNMHLNLVNDIDIKFDNKLNVLTLNISNNIMLNTSIRDVLDKKKKFFEKVFLVKVQFGSL